MGDDSIAVKAARGAGWVFAWRMLTRLLGLASTLVLVRYLDPADFGLVAIAVAFAGGIDALSSIGIEYALLRERDTDRKLYDTAFTLNVIRGFITVVVVIAAAWPVAAFMNDPRLVPLMLVMSIALMMSSMENIGIVEFRRDFVFDKEFWLFLLPRVLGVASNIGLILVWPSYWVLVIGTLLTRASRMVLSYVIHPYRPRLSLAAWRPLLSYSIWLWAEGMVGMLRERLDPVLIGRILDPMRVGIFSIGMEIARLPGTEIMQPISRALFPSFAAAMHAGISMRDGYCRAMAAIATVVLPVCFGMSLLADPIVRLMLGSNWLATIPFVQILGAAGAISVIGYTASNVLGVAGKTRVQFLLALGGICLRIPLLILLTWKYELFGVVIALTISSVVDTLAMTLIVARYLRVGFLAHIHTFWRPVLATAAMAFGLTVLGFGWAEVAGGRMELILHTVLAAGLGGVFYCSALTLAWLAAGRPQGAERFLAELGMGAARRLQRMGRPS